MRHLLILLALLSVVAIHSCSKDPATENPDETNLYTDADMFNEISNGSFYFYKSDTTTLSAAGNSPHGTFKLLFNQTAKDALGTDGKLAEISYKDVADLPEAAPAIATPLDLFSRPFDNPEAKPLFSLVLLDDGAPDTDRETLAALPFPITFAIDPLAPGAAAAAAFAIRLNILENPSQNIR